MDSIESDCRSLHSPSNTIVNEMGAVYETKNEISKSKRNIAKKYGFYGKCSYHIIL